MTTPPRPSNRREEIIAATLDVITSHGLAGASLRRIASACGVSLGSITYHFADRDTLLNQALRAFVDDSVASFEAAFADITSLDDARAAAVQVLTEAASSYHTAAISSELYTLSLRRPRHRLLLIEWAKATRNAMGKAFDDETAHILDAFYEGLLLHRRMVPAEHNDELIAEAVKRLTPPSGYIGPNS